MRSFSKPGKSVSVLAVGAGGTGMATALELARRGVSLRIIDKSPLPPISSRGIGIHPRTLELLSLHGLVDAFLDVGRPQRGLFFCECGQETASVDFTLAPSTYPTIAVPQAESERILRAAIEQRGNRVEWGKELVDVSIASDRVIARVRNRDDNEEMIESEWLVGCDGARSTVRGVIQASFEGESYPEAWGLIDCRVNWNIPEDSVRVFRDAEGRQLVVVPLGSGRFRLQIDQRPAAIAGDPPAVQEMEQEVRRRTGMDARITDIVWASPYRLHRRIADRFRRGRIFIAGDAAHIHSPYGAQGLNTGIQDGVNLGWKLGLVASGHAVPLLLDSYEAERRPIALKVIELSHALLRHTQEIAGAADRRRQLAAIVSGCAAGYREGPLSRRGSKWYAGALPPGDRVPDANLANPTARDTALYELLSAGAPSLVLLAGRGRHDPSAVERAACMEARWKGLVRVLLIDENGADHALARSPQRVADARGELRGVLGLSKGEPATIIVRPDAYLAFASGSEALDEADAYLTGVMGLLPD